MRNVWGFDIGKIVVPIIFLDSDLLANLGKKYDHITRVVKNYVGDNLFRFCYQFISEVFNLNPNHDVHDLIDMEDLQERYDVQRVYVRAGSLQQHFSRIGKLTLVTSTALELLMRKYFNLRAQYLYFTLCKIFGMYEEEYIHDSIVLIIAQTLQFGMSSILDFATFLAQEIPNGLVGISQGKVKRPFCWCSLLMHICLYKGVTFFSKGMELELTKYGEKLPVQLWSVDMTWEARNASYVRFDKYFASKLRLLLRGDSPRLPLSLLDLIRPKDQENRLLVSNNLVDIISYNVSTMIRVYGFLGIPHVLHFHVPLKIGIAKLLWQIRTIEERDMVGKGKGTFFSIVTLAHDFFFLKKGWRHLNLLLDRYNMAESHVRYIDPKGFYDLLRKRTKAKNILQQVYFPKDIIRNIFSLH